MMFLLKIIALSLSFHILSIVLTLDNRRNNHVKSVRMKKKILLLTLLVLLLAPMLPVQAQNDDVRLSMSFCCEPLPMVFERLEKSSSYRFLFTYDDVVKYRITLSVKDAKFFDIVNRVLANTDLEYDVKGKFINITTRGSKDVNKDKGALHTVGGYVYDKATGEPVIGAQLRIVGTKVITVSDINGAFTFDYFMTEKSRVQVSYVGMKTVTLPIRQHMKIYLETETHQLGGVVVTGIFRKAKESYTGAVSTIDREQLDMYRGSNLLQTLKNVDASLNFPINNAAGSNPNVLPNLNIRGTSSIPMNVEEFNTNAEQTVNTPLIILDGFEISLTKLMDYNDEQIESINILKDAAATAIYGSRGANGVIVVVTKQPKNGRLRVTAKAGLSLEIPDLSSYDLLNAREKLQLEKQIGLYTSNYESTQILLNSYYNERLKNVIDGVDIDWLHKPVHTGVGQRYNLQLDGGAEAFRWGASIGYNGIEGAMKTSNRRTINGDITLMYSVKNFTFRNYTSFTSNKANNGRYGSFQDYVDMEPYDSPYDADGNLVPYFYDYRHSSTHIGNPLYDASLNIIDKSDYQEFINNFSVEWIPIDGLHVRGKIGVTTNRSSSDYFLPAEHSMFTDEEYTSATGLMRRGRYTYGTGRDDLISGNLTVSYSKTFADKHQVYVGADYSISEEKTDDKSFVAEGFSNSDLNFIGNARQYLQNGTPSGDKNTVRLVGVTGNANYTYDNRYYVDLSYRVDGSSKFGSDKRFAPFWSVGTGWNIQNEKFMKKQHFFSRLRLKASYGITGSQDFTTQDVYSTYKYDSGNYYLGWSSAQLAGLGNEELTWQKTKELNLGAEIGILDHRATLEFNYYTKKTTNLLSAMDLPLSSGFSSYTANVGEMKNTGFEASATAYIIRDYERHFNWMIGGQLVYNKNKIERLSDAIKRQNEAYMAQSVEVSNLLFEGKPLNAIYAVRSAGIDPSTGEEVFYDRDGNLTNTWRASDKVYLGSSEPLWRGNFRTMVMWHNFTFNASFGYHWGGKLYNSTLRDRVEVTRQTIGSQNVDSRVLSERWAQPGDNTFFRNFNDNYTPHATSRYVFDDRVLQLQSISLQYRWNSDWLHKVTHLESAVFAINASDLFYWSSVKYERGTSYPYARNVQGTVTLTF